MEWLKVVSGPEYRTAEFRLRDSARFMANPSASNCNFDGNPLHEERLEIVRMLGGALALNTVIDEERQLSFQSEW